MNRPLLRLVKIAARTAAVVLAAAIVWNAADLYGLEWDQTRPDRWRS